MKIYSIQSFSGKNIYSHRPVIKLYMDLQDLHSLETKDIENFNASLLRLFPGLCSHYCSYGHEGGFVKRLHEGTFLGHVTEHLILELQNILGYNVRFGKTRVVKEPSLYYVVYEYMNEKCGIECARAAVRIIDGLVNAENIPIQGIISDIRRVAVESELGPSARSIYDEALKRGIPVTRLGTESLIQLGYGKHMRFMEASLSDSTKCVSVDIAGNKHLTKQILSDNDIPVPHGDIAYTEESAAVLAAEVGYPVVVKPYDANQGKGVTLNINDDAQVRAAYREAMKYSKAVIVERYIKGNDYRVLVVGDKVSAVSERRPPSVKGDGIHTVKELVDTENSNELRGIDHEKPLTRIKLDGVALQLLSRKGVDESYIPAKNETVTLRENGNLSTGGTARDCTGEIHPYNAYIAVKAAKAVGLDIAGVDITTEDISVSLENGSGAVIEINAAPGLRMHLYPTEGKPNNVAADIVDMLFPEGAPYTIPIVSVTGTNGKTTTTRLIRHVLTMAGFKVGMTSTSGVFVGDRCILKGDNTGPVSARMVLSHREVEAAVLETARGGILRKGLGYDLADVGVITNIAEDHLGLDNIDTLEDMAFVKSLVVEAVKPDGYSVLNADDRMVDYLVKRAKGNIILFSKCYDNILLVKHMKSGGKAVYVKDGSVWRYDGESAVNIIGINDIPITFGGMLGCNVENSLAAAAALYSMGISDEIIKKGMAGFKPDIDTNPGRFNIFDMGNFRVMLDYGHNPAGYGAVIEFMHRLGASRYIGIIGMPGDRSDSSMKEVGEMCGRAFSRVYIKEDEDLRGRKPGETAEIFYNAVLAGGMRKENISIILPEEKALETAMLDAQPGDLLVMLYEKFEPAVETVMKLKDELDGSENQPAAAVGESAG